MVTVRELITLLIEQNMDDEVILRDEKGESIHNSTIYVREVGTPKTLGALFG